MTKGITFGAFDLLHGGHIQFLKQARQKVDHLTVGLHIDPSTERETKNKPLENVWTRFEKLRSLTFVDDVIPYEFEFNIYDILSSEKYHYRFVGSDYIHLKISYENLVHVIYIDRPHTYSSSNMRKIVLDAEKLK